MQRLCDQIARVAPSEATVLILGESGSGKERVAQALHLASRRRAGPFVPVNCGAIASGLIEAELLGHERGGFTGAVQTRGGYFERADGGTLFLDEIAEMPLEMQVKLLRVLETRRFQRVGGTETLSVDLRVIAATHRDLAQAVREGRFREDLMYRVAVVLLQVPPLRERGEDIALLAQQVIDELNAQEGTRKTLSRKSRSELLRYRWPGNVRELRNSLTRAFILADESVEFRTAQIGRERLRPALVEGRLQIEIGTSLADTRRELILATVDAAGGDKRRAAATLGVSIKTLYNRLEEYRSAGGDAGSAS